MYSLNSKKSVLRRGGGGNKQVIGEIMNNIQNSIAIIVYVEFLFIWTNKTVQYKNFQWGGIDKNMKTCNTYYVVPTALLSNTLIFWTEHVPTHFISYLINLNCILDNLPIISFYLLSLKTHIRYNGLLPVPRRAESLMSEVSGIV
jgi:hypothetical protein